MFDVAMIESAVLMALRMLWPALGGAAIVSESELSKLAGALVVVGSIAYHAVKRYRGRQRER